MRSPRIRVLHCIPQLHRGGVQRQLRLLLQGLDSSLFRSGVCCAEDAGSQDLPETVDVWCAPRRSRWSLPWRRLREVLREFRPDVVHVWNGSMLPVCLPPARLASDATCLAAYQSAYDPRNPRSLFYYIVCAGLAHRLVSNLPPRVMRQPYRWLFRRKDGVSVPNGVDTSSIRSAAPIGPGLAGGAAGGARTILFVGRLIEDKNLTALLRALPLLVNRGVEARLWACGVGPQRRLLVRRATELGIADRVDFLGHRDDVYSLMRSADVLAAPSLREGMPNVVFEAMAADLPVVAADIPPIAVWVRPGENGLLVNPGDPPAIASAVATVLEDSELAGRLAAGGRRTAEALTIARMTGSFAELYVSLAKRATGSDTR